MAELQDILSRLEGMSTDDKSAVLRAIATGIPLPPDEEDPPPQPPPTSVVFPPRLSMFSGETDKDARYSLWRAEVIGLQSSHTEQAILQAMRRSTKSLAADVLLHLPSTTTVKDILAKFDKMFGIVQPAELQYENFYTARQNVGETIVAWACRLEQIIANLKSVDPSLTSAATENMLSTKFWSGLAAPAARDALRHLRDNKATFTDLLVAARQYEAEGSKPTSATSSTLQGATANPELSEIKSTLIALNKRLEAMEKNQQQKRDSRPFNGKCHNCHQRGHKKYECTKSGNDNDQL